MSDYDYEASGFDAFLSRSIDNLSQANLDAGGPLSNQLRYDATQVSGLLGDVVRFGNITIDGVKGTIAIGSDKDGAGIFIDGAERVIRVTDENNNRIRIGNIHRNS